MLVFTNVFDWVFVLDLKIVSVLLSIVVVCTAVVTAAFGQIALIPFPLRICPISVFGSVAAPSQSMMTNWSTVSILAIQFAEQGAPFVKSELVQPASGVL